jgi:hypothetical protein
MKDNLQEQLTHEFEVNPTFAELDNETSAAILGGWNIEFYDTNDFKGFLGGFNDGGKPSLINNDKISSIIVREGKWRLYQHANYNTNPGDQAGAEETYGRQSFLRPGRYVLPPGLNNEVSSFQRVGI